MAATTANVPDRIGLYTLVKPLGQGGMGTTFEAMRPDLDKPCALKIMHSHLAPIPKYRELFNNEAKIGAQLRHGRIVSVFDRGEHEGRPYLVMERVDGVNLEQLLKALRKQKGGLLELSLVVLIMEALLEGLIYAHGRLLNQQHDIGVIHHDITPGNIMISSHGEVLLTDFGIARFVDESGRESKPMGTLLYMAPEQLMGSVSRQSDLYSLGAVLHELLTGSPPLGKVPKDQRRAALLVEPIPPTGRDDVPPALEALRVALLQKHPEKRLRSATEGLLMLKQYDGPKASSTELSDLYLRLIGPQSSGWTGYLRCAERQGDPPIQSEWLARLNPAQPKLDASAPEPEDAEDEDDQTCTRPWQASPPPLDANAASLSGAGIVAEPGTPSTDDVRTRHHEWLIRRRPRDNGTGPDPDGRVEAPARRSQAVLRPIAVAAQTGAAQAVSRASSPPEASTPPRVVTDVLPRAMLARKDGAEIDADSSDAGRECLASTTARLLHAPGRTEPDDHVQASEVTS